MKVLVALSVLTWSHTLFVKGNLIESLPESSQRGFFPGYFPPYQPTYPPYNVPPECFPQPVCPEVPPPQECPVPECPDAEGDDGGQCICEPKLNTCQTYTITVCPPGAQPAPAAGPEETAPVVEVIEEKIVDTETGQVLAEKQEVIDVTPEFKPQPQVYGGFPAFPGLHPFSFPYGGFPQFGQSLDAVSALRSLGDEKESSDRK